MQKTQKITSRILSEAKEYAEEVIAAAKAEADEKLEAARQQAEAIRRQSELEAFQAAEEHKKRRASAIESELRKEMLSTKRKLLDSVFEKALAKLAGMSSKEQIAVMVRRIMEVSPDGLGEVMLTKKDAGAFGNDLINALNEAYAKKGVKAGIKLSGQNINAIGGFILKIGDIEYNGTYEALVKLIKEEMEGKIALMLFPDDKSDK
jgi:V/A-type H+-transporting ATPase subunit E